MVMIYILGGIGFAAILTLVLSEYIEDRREPVKPDSAKEFYELTEEDKKEGSFYQLYKELTEQCYFAQDVQDWWKLRKKQIKKLPHKQYQKLLNQARHEIECDYMCI